MEVWALFEVFGDGDGYSRTVLLNVWETLESAKEAATQEENRIINKFPNMQYPFNEIILENNKLHQYRKLIVIGKRSDLNECFSYNFKVKFVFLIEKLTVGV